MEDDIELMHYVVRKGVQEHKKLLAYTYELRSLLRMAVMGNKDEIQAEEVMRKLMKLQEEYKEFVCSDSLK